MFTTLGSSLALCLAAGAPLTSGALESSYEWDIELTSMDLNVHNALLPLGPGWSVILTDLHIGESVALASKGKAYATAGKLDAVVGGNGSPDGTYQVSSFFDVFFDITLTDVDPDLNFGGAPDGAMPSLLLPNVGPAHMQNFYSAVANENLPNLGLIPPPEAFPYIGHFNIEILLGADLNGNGVNDKIKFTLAAHQVGDENRTFITLPDGTVIDNFDSALDLSGAVVDELDDPPFSVTLTGPVSATSTLLPEPSTYAAAVAVLAMAGWTVRRRRQG